MAIQLLFVMYSLIKHIHQFAAYIGIQLFRQGYPTRVLRHNYATMLGFARLRFKVIQLQGIRKNEYLCAVPFHHTLRFNQATMRTTITHNNFGNCGVSFSSFVRQSFSKQLYVASICTTSNQTSKKIWYMYV